MKTKKQNTDQLTNRVLKKIRSLPNLPKRLRVGSDTSIFDLAGQDWHTAINRTFEFERLFEIEFTDTEGWKIESGTVATVVNFLVKKVKL